MKSMNPSKENDPQSWGCAICPISLKASNELTFHYMSHSMLELALALTNLQRVEKGLEPSDAPVLNESDIGEDNDKFDQDICDNDEEESVKERDLVKDGSSKKRTSIRHKPESQVYSCSQCGKILSSKGNLKKHKVLHLSVKPWHCKDCNQFFNQARDLKSHQMQKHSGERPYVCKICGKGFVHKYYLNEHLDYHTGDRKWQCSECGKTFQSSSTLAKHVQRHGSDRSFSCQLCLKAFTVKVDLRSHIKLVHEKLGSAGQSTGIPVSPTKIRQKVTTPK